MVGGSVEGKLVWQKRRPNLEWTKSGLKKAFNVAPEVGTRFGAQKWVPNLAPRSGYQIWCQEVGTQFGAQYGI